MGRIGKPKLKYILQTNNNVYEFLNKIAMNKFIKELQIDNYKIDIIELTNCFNVIKSTQEEQHGKSI